MDAEQVQAIVDAAIAAFAAGAAAAAGPPPAAAGPVTFSINPANAKVGIINYDTTDGIKIYQSATAALATKYTGNTIDMYDFLKNVKDRADSFGWGAIVTIPKDGLTKDLIEQYGLITLDDIRAHAQMYVNEQGRDAQNASQMYKFLYASLTEEAKRMVWHDSDEYSITNAAGSQVLDGPCFLKVIIRNTTVDTRSTIFHIRENLRQLETKMIDFTYDIEAFNLYVTSQVEQLSARGEVSSDLLINIFAAYMSVPDRKFVEYIEKQKDRFDEGEDIDSKKMMQVALIKFKDRKRADKWQAPSAQEEQIIALTAQVSALSKGRGDQGKKGGTKKDPEAGKKKIRDAKYAEQYAWKLIAPAPGEPKTKEVGKKTYNFCMHHNDGAGAWVIHHPDNCDRRSSKPPKKDTGKATTNEKALNLSKALQAIQDDSDCESSGEEDE